MDDQRIDGKQTYSEGKKKRGELSPLVPKRSRKTIFGRYGAMRRHQRRAPSGATRYKRKRKLSAASHVGGKKERTPTRYPMKEELFDRAHGEKMSTHGLRLFSLSLEKTDLEALEKAPRTMAAACAGREKGKTFYFFDARVLQTEGEPGIVVGISGKKRLERSVEKRATSTHDNSGKKGGADFGLSTR